MKLLELRSPMLAPNKVPKIEDIIPHLPMYASVKMDGIRCLIINGDLISRSGKPLPNQLLRDESRIKKLMVWCEKTGHVVDGEIWSPGMRFEEITSIVMTKINPIDPEEHDLTLWAFDCLTYEEWQSQSSIQFEFRPIRLPEDTQRVKQHLIEDADQLQKLYNYFIGMDDEGLIVRDCTGYYKWGRCTTKEANIFKLKEVDDIDAVVIGYGPLETMVEGAERETNEFGRLKTVHRQELKQDTEALGYLLVRDEKGREFRVGSGFKMHERLRYWKERTTLTGQWIKIKSTAHGVKDLPRQPIFKGFRDAK